jgi:hypothetical protein
MDLHRRISAGDGEFLLFAVTPPRSSVTPDRAQEIADVTLERLRHIDLDGLVVYDIDDESDRVPGERPFPFLPTMDPAHWVSRHLADRQLPAIVYRAVGKYPEADLRSWVTDQDPSSVMSVFVGASSHDKPVATTLPRAHQIRAECGDDLMVGGVAIPERHTRRGDEHKRLLAKQEAGCSFFVTQVVYDVTAAKNLISDYWYECRARGVRPAPIVFTFTTVGSVKTLDFLTWLGVDVPRWIQNEIRSADRPLDASYQEVLAMAVDLIGYCRNLGAPFGLNVESVSIRRSEIEQSVRLAARLREELDRTSR